MVFTGEFHEITEMLQGYSARCQELGVPLTTKFTADNCCSVRSYVQAGVPVLNEMIEVCLDVHHAKKR